MFKNAKVSTADIPRLDEASFEPVAPAYLSVVWAITAAVVMGFMGVLAVLWAFGIGAPALLAGVGGVVVSGGLIKGLAQRYETKRKGFLLREHDVSVRNGVLWARVETVPFSRVQSVTLDRGLLNRAFGMSALTIQTAGGPIYLVGLLEDEAEAVKAMVVERAYLAAEAEQSALVSE